MKIIKNPTNASDARAALLVARENAAARQKHGLTLERGGVDRRLRIITEEVGEVARAIQDLEDAERELAENDFLARSTFSPNLDQRLAARELSRQAVVARRRELVAEVVQVASAASRWASVELENDPEFVLP